VRIEILMPSEEEIRFAEDDAAGQGVAIVVPPVSFGIQAVNDDQAAEISGLRISAKQRKKEGCAKLLLFLFIGS